MPLKIGEGKDWLDNKFNDNNIFLKRFYDIFGPDNAKDNGGSMNAGNLLNTIPLELKINDDKNNNDYKAFIVLAIFKSLLLKPDVTNFNTLDWNKIKKENSNFCRGWLYQLYVSDRSFICKYETDKTNIYLFSHSGLARNIIEKAPSIYDELIGLFKSKTNLYNLLTDVSYYYNKPTLTGGYYADDKTYLKIKVEEINNYFNSKIKTVLDDESYQKLPTPDMLFLMCMVTILDSKELQAKFPKKFDNLDFGKLELLTPVQSGFGIMRNKEYNFFVEGYNLYQIFGHKPLGFGTTINFIKKNENTRLLLIILDTSNTFRATSIDKNYKESYNYFEINSSSNPKNTSNINIIEDTDKNKDGKQNFEFLKFDITNNKNNEISNKFYYSSDLNINNIQIEENKIDGEFRNYIRKANGNETYQVNFHGYKERANERDFIFSINYGAYDKSLFYLNKKDFEYFFNTSIKVSTSVPIKVPTSVPTSVPPKVTPSVSTSVPIKVPTSVPIKVPTSVPPSVPPSVPDIIKNGGYYEKYLKYKNKYLQLKNII